MINLRRLGAIMTMCAAFACGVEQVHSTVASTGPAVGPPPGKLCTATDPNFQTYRYKEHIPYCNRNVPETLKDAVAARYGVAKANYSLYEFDHYIPLNAGGSDDIDNLWPQPLAQAHQKDTLELQIFNGLTAGTLTQAAAVAEIKAWQPK